ncbi:MAG: YfhO family protein [Ligilactobacillus ruminis]
MDSATSKLDVKDIDYNKVDKNIDRTVENRVKNFKRDNTGFSFTTNYVKEKLVWFSVPYDKGWDAALDGRKIDVINSGGMMAIKVPKGEHKAVFNGLKQEP